MRESEEHVNEEHEREECEKERRNMRLTGH